MPKKLFLLSLIFLLSLSCGCSFLLQPSQTQEEADMQTHPIKESEKEKDGDYRVVCFEIGTDPASNHFEYRVANIYSINPDGSDRQLIYSDIDNRFGLGRAYSVSPDGTKISCSFFEGGRGAYSSLSIMDIATGNVAHMAEFDYTGGKMPEY